MGEKCLLLLLACMLLGGGEKKCLLMSPVSLNETGRASACRGIGKEGEVRYAAGEEVAGMPG